MQVLIRTQVASGLLGCTLRQCKGRRVHCAAVHGAIFGCCSESLQLREQPRHMPRRSSGTWKPRILDNCNPCAGGHLTYDVTGNASNGIFFSKPRVPVVFASGLLHCTQPLPHTGVQ
jgi:hypothetical protein